MEKNKKEEEEMIVHDVLLDNFAIACITMAENKFDKGYENLLSAIRINGIFSAESFGGEITVEGKDVDVLNCSKVIGIIY